MRAPSAQRSARAAKPSLAPGTTPLRNLGRRSRDQLDLITPGAGSTACLHHGTRPPFACVLEVLGRFRPPGSRKQRKTRHFGPPGRAKCRVFSIGLRPGPGGVPGGASRRRRGPPGAARRLPEDAILIRTVKHVVSEAQVRQNVVNLRISEGVPGGASGGPNVRGTVRKVPRPPYFGGCLYNVVTP